ncbi:gstcd [Symbiodinium natans]|uniref:Gstcd protein n=1 Tax=Symbiodinium natans TaxID=878477 RepID=A0A812MCN0_9DINO|nr:gstcd [Symbiodinium natans]
MPMNASIVGKYGFRRRAEQRTAAVASIWAQATVGKRFIGKFASRRARVACQWLCDALQHIGKVCELVEAEACQSSVTGGIHWETLPKADIELSCQHGASALDPADGELDMGRASRKRAQVDCLASYALQMMEGATKVVEFGAGSGHLGLLLASQRPDCQVVLVEAKAYSADVASRRIEGTGIANCRVFHGTVDAFAATGEDFDLAVGLHLCGLLTDAVLGLARRRRAAACVVPCCYGQVATLKEDHQRGEGTAQRMHPCSQAMRMISTEAQLAMWATPLRKICIHFTLHGFCWGSACEDFAWCAKAADFTAGKGGVFDPDGEGFRTAWSSPLHASVVCKCRLRSRA